jgi:hypothetical protein
MLRGLTSLLPRWLLFVLAIPLLVAGCASSAGVAPKARTFQKVGVISLAGGYLTQMKVGLTVFGNEYSETDVTELAPDRGYELLVVDALRNTGLEATQISTVPEKLKTLFQPSTLKHVAFDLDSRWSSAEDLLKEVARSHKVDALVLLVPMTSGDYFGGTNQLLRGFGIYTRSSAARLHLISRLVVIFGPSGKPIGHTPVSAVQPTFPGGPHQRGQPSIGIDPGLGNTPFSSMTVEQKTRLKETAMAIPLGGAIDATISQLLPTNR